MEVRTPVDGSADEECYLELRDFTPVIVHRARRRDRAAVLEFVRRMSPETIELRFGSPMLEEAVSEEILGAGPAEHRVALVLETIGRVPRIVGSAEYVVYPGDAARAEVAFLLEDEFQGRGAGTLLLHELARRARVRGVRRFTAIVAQENTAMRDVFRNSGYPYTIVRDGTQWLIELEIGAPAAGPTLGTTSHLGPAVP